MIDRHQEAELLKSLSNAYQEIIEMKAIGKAGAGSADDGGKYGEKNQAIGGGWIGKQGGIGADKREKNNPSADDRRAARQAGHHKAGAANRAAERRAEPKNKLEAGGDPKNKAKAAKPQSRPKVKGLDTPAGRNRAATKEMRRSGWKGYDNDTPEKPFYKKGKRVR